MTADRIIPTLARKMKEKLKERLRRLDKLTANHPFYFITLCTYQRQQLLANYAVHQMFCAFAVEACERNVFVGRYVFMPDHVHFFAALVDQTRLSLWIKALKNSLSKALRAKGHASPHWQKGFFDHLMRSEESYVAKWTYVAENPVRHGLVAEASQWPYQGEINALPFR